VSRRTDIPRLSYLVKQLQVALRIRLDAVVQPFGLTAKQFTALTVLSEHPGMSSAALGRITFVTAQAAHEMVTILQNKDFVERSIDEHDRKRLQVKLTATGLEVLDECNRRVDALEAEVFHDLDADEQARFRQTLDTCLDAIRSPGPPPPS
jgi:DNA-binding MarR family transcriptional regulator